MTRPGSLHMVFLLLACLLALCHGLYFWTDTIDDAYISFRYAANLADGEGLVFNPGERVEGYSNLLWTLGAALFIFLGFDPMLTAKLAGLASAMLTIVVLDRLLARTVRTWAARLAGLALTALAVPAAFWSVQGLETSFFTLLLCLAFHRFGEELEWERGFPWSALFFALACLTRPEGPLYLLVFAGVRLAYGRWRRRQDLDWLLIFLIPMIAHGLWRRLYFGELLPNTYFAKGTAGVSALSLQAHADGAAYIGSFLAGAWGLPAIFGILGLVAAVVALLPRKNAEEPLPDNRRIRRCRLLLPVLWLAATFFFAWQANGDWMPNARFLVPGIPALALLAAVGIDSAARWVEATCRRFGGPDGDIVPGRPSGTVSSGLTASFLAGLLLVGLLAESGLERRTPASTTRTKEWGRGFNRSGGQHPRLLPMAMYLMETLRDGETVVYGDIGIVGYLNPELRIIDNRGLTHRVMARLIYNRPHRMDEARRLSREFLKEFGRVRPEAAVVVINRRANVPVWQTEVFGLHPSFHSNYAEARRLTHRGQNTEIACLRRDLIRRTLEPGEVIAHYRRAIELAPRISALYLRLAHLCRAAGRHDLRRDTLENASRRFAGNAAVLKQLKQEVGR